MMWFVESLLESYKVFLWRWTSARYPEVDWGILFDDIIGDLVKFRIVLAEWRNKSVISFSTLGAYVSCNPQ